MSEWLEWDLIEQSPLNLTYWWMAFSCFDCIHQGKRVMFLLPRLSLVDYINKEIARPKGQKKLHCNKVPGLRNGKTYVRAWGYSINPFDIDGRIVVPFTEDMEDCYQKCKAMLGNDPMDETWLGDTGEKVARVYFSKNLKLQVSKKDPTLDQEYKGHDFYVEDSKWGIIQAKCRAEDQSYVLSVNGGPTKLPSKVATVVDSQGDMIPMIFLQMYERNKEGISSIGKKHDGKKNHNAGGSGVEHTVVTGSGILDPVAADYAVAKAA
jgi:hypothetical protein